MFRLDTHVHTSESSRCGKLSARDTVDLYKQCGYDAIVITDHYQGPVFEEFGDELSWDQKLTQYLKGYHAALERGKEVGLTVLLGAELRFPGRANDYLVFGIDEEFLKAYPRLYERPIAGVKKLLSEHNCLLFQAHPFRNNTDRDYWQLLDGMEVYNANERHDSKNDKAKAFAEKHNLIGISGSDCHRAQDVGRGGLVFEQPVRSGLELVEALKNRRFELIMN